MTAKYFSFTNPNKAWSPIKQAMNYTFKIQGDAFALPSLNIQFDVLCINCLFQLISINNVHTHYAVCRANKSSNYLRRMENSVAIVPEVLLR